MTPEHDAAPVAPESPDHPAGTMWDSLRADRMDNGTPPAAWHGTVPPTWDKLSPALRALIVAMADDVADQTATEAACQAERAARAAIAATDAANAALPLAQRAAWHAAADWIAADSLGPAAVARMRAACPYGQPEPEPPTGDQLPPTLQAVLRERQADAEPPVIVIPAGQPVPWGNDRHCPTCRTGPLPLHDSDPPGLTYIAHCGSAWLRGPITPQTRNKLREETPND